MRDNRKAEILMNQLICEMCGGSDLIKQDGVFVCQYCGAKYSVEEAKKIINAEKIKIDGTVKISNNEFNAKLANANNWAQLYFQRGAKTVTCGCLKGYDAVVEYYKDAELAGANESQFYIDFSRFYVRANLEGFADGSRYLKDRGIFVNHYIFLMDNAIKYAEKDNVPELTKEKNETLAKLEIELKKYKEKKVGCYVATCVYGSYDCPQVWILRRYRDNILASTWYGRVFIRTYYAISPTIVKWFGNTQWFKNHWKSRLDKMVSNLQTRGLEDAPYQD